MFSKILMTIFYVLTCCYVFFIAYEQSLDVNNYVLLLVIVCGLCIAYCISFGKQILSSKKSGYIEKQSESKVYFDSLLFAIIVSGCLLRLFFYNKNTVDPISDFKLFYDEIMAISHNSVTFSKSYGFVVPYGFILRSIKPCVFSIQLVTIIVYIVSTILSYKLSFILFNSHLSGVITAFFISTYPPFVLYSAVVASEHIWFMYLLIVFVLEYALLNKMNSSFCFITKLCLALILGFFIQITAFTRGNSSILLPVIIFMILFLKIKPLKTTFCVVLAICLGSFIPKAYLYYVERTNNKFLSGDATSAYVMVIGTNLETRGRYNTIDPALLNERYQEKYGRNERRKKRMPLAIEYVLEKWKENPYEEYQLALEKIGSAARVRNQGWILGWFVISNKTDGSRIYSFSKQDEEYLEILTPIYQTTYSLFSFFSLFVLPLLDKKRKLVIYSVIIFLFFCMVLQGIHEYMARYSLVYFWGLSILGGAFGKRYVSKYD